MNMNRTVVLAWALALIAAAGGAPAEAGPTVREKPSKAGGYALQSTHSIGGADASEDADFYERYGPVGVDADANGNVYVLDNGNVRVQVFDAKGNLIRSLGSEGDGPGEFRIPASISVNAAGDFAVFDVGQGRVTVMDATGKLLYDLLLQGMAKDIALQDDRSLVLGFGKVGPAAVQAFDANGDLIWSGGSRNTPSGPHIEMEIGIQTVAPRLAVVEDAAFRCPKGDYELQRFTKDTESVFSRPFERRKFTEDELAPPSDDEGGEPQVIMIRREGPDGGHGGGGGTPGGAPKFTSEEGETHTFDMESLRSMMPSHHSATRGVLAWPDGRVWVLTSERGRNGLHADEWSANGEWLRRFDVHEDYDWLKVGRDGRLYGVTHDEDDYPTVHWLEVREGA